MKKKLKIFFLFVLMLLTTIFTIDSLVKKNFTLTNDEFLEVLLVDPSIGNNTVTKKKVMTKAMEVLSGVRFDNITSFIFNNKEYHKNNVIEKDKEVFNTKINEPLIYIYNTHQQEQYDAGNLKHYNITPTVLTASYILEDAFKKYGISVIVEEKDIIKELNKRKYSYNKTYKITRELFQKNKDNYKTLEYFIDVHRDSVSKKISTIEIDGKFYAKPMFVIGMNNKNYQKNLKLMEELETKIDKKYPNLSRGIYKRNEVYNQDLHDNAILIEIGGVLNSIEEVYNTCYVIAGVLVEYIGEQSG